MVFAKKDHSITTYIHLTWLISGGIAAFASLFMFFLIGWVEHRNASLRIQDALSEKSVVAARRLAGELLVGPSGAVGPVSRLLEKELNLAHLELIQEPPPCPQTVSSIDETCIIQRNDTIFAYRKIPYIKGSYFIKIANPTIPYIKSLQPTLLLWAVLPLLSLLIIGLVLQQECIKHFVLIPIRSLVKTTLETDDPPGHWPREIKDIAKRLAKTFDDRDQFILNQIATGVIHDIKALLHPLLSATELVTEQPEGSPKRPHRLENLYRASLRNLPKIKEIIQITLDGTRDILIRSKPASIDQTIQSAVAVNQEFASSRGVEIQVEKMGASKLVPHDMVQLERVFINLIKNGIEAFDESTSKKIIRISSNQLKQGEISIVVEDSGPGVTGPIFKPLRSNKYQGAGLGLVISKKIVESHGGTIHVSRSNGLGGACFEVIIPTSCLATNGGLYESAIPTVSC